MTDLPQDGAQDLDTLPKILIRNHDLHGEKVAMRHKVKGVWKEYTWRDCHEYIKDFSLGLTAIGLAPGDRVAIIGDPEPQWYWSEVATLAAGGIALGIYSETPSSQLQRLLSHSDTVFLVARDREQVDKVIQIQKELPKLKKIIYWDKRGLENHEDPSLVSLYEVADMGKKYEQTHPQAWKEAVAWGKGNDHCLINYTSGTTSPLPKAAIFSHNSLMYAASWLADLGLVRPGDNYVCYLSPANCLEQQVGIAAGMLLPFIVNFPERPESAYKDFREIGPQFAIFLPRRLEEIVGTVEVGIEGAGFLSRFAYGHAMALAHDVVERRTQGDSAGILQQAGYLLADLAVFRAIRDRFGLSNARAIMTGGAHLHREVFRFFHSLGVPLLQVYLLTECPLCIAQTPGDLDLRSMGKPTIRHEVRLSSEGEILVRGATLCHGYHKAPESTDLQLQGGWLHTGDIGDIDEFNRVAFVGQAANLIRLANGSTCFPEPVESALRLSPYIQDALVTGASGHDYLSAMITLDRTNISTWAARRGVPYESFEQLSRRPEVSELIRGEIARANNDLTPAEKVRRFILLPKVLKSNEGELTVTGKPRRGYLRERYETYLSTLYRDEAKVAPGRESLEEKDQDDTCLRVETVEEGSE